MWRGKVILRVSYLIGLLEICIILLLQYYRDRSQVLHKFDYITNHIVDPKAGPSFSFVSVPHNITRLSPIMFAMRTWLAAFPKAELILVCENGSYNFKEILEFEFPLATIIIIPPVLGLNNRPLIRHWFEVGVNISRHDYLIYINSDIFLSSNFNKKLKHMINTIYKENPNITSFLLVTLRINMKQIKPFDDMATLDNLNDYLSFKGQFYTNGCDVYIFPRRFPPFPLRTIPDFVAGLPRWDNFFLNHSIVNSLAIQFTEYEPVYHLEHPKGWDQKPLRYPMRTYVFKIVKIWDASNTTGAHVSHAQMKFTASGTLVVINHTKIKRTVLRTRTQKFTPYKYNRTTTKNTENITNKTV